jgi:hypothetical protein
MMGQKIGKAAHTEARLLSITASAVGVGPSQLGSLMGFGIGLSK